MRRCTVVAKQPLLFAGAFGFGVWLSGLVFFDRLQTEQARLLMKEAVDRVVKEKTKLWIFPEGLHINNGSIQPFEKGAFFLAIDAQIPVMPVVFSHYYFLDDETRTLEPGKIMVTTLPPIPTVGLTSKDVAILSERVRSAMLANYVQTSRELSSDSLAL